MSPATWLAWERVGIGRQMSSLIVRRIYGAYSVLRESDRRKAECVRCSSRVMPVQRLFYVWSDQTATDIHISWFSCRRSSPQRFQSSIRWSNLWIKVRNANCRQADEKGAKRRTTTRARSLRANGECTGRWLVWKRLCPDLSTRPCRRRNFSSRGPAAKQAVQVQCVREEKLCCVERPCRVTMLTF